jgi:hypothetical protein
MSNKQLTAVQWYAGRSHDIERLLKLGAISIVEYYEEQIKAVQQAKEMEEEKMIEFAYNALKIADNTRNRYVDVDKLYKELYGGGEQ